MSQAISVPVLIVGAGPAGLTLACDLARRGIRSRIIDKADRLFIGSRGKGLQPRTMEVFHDLEVIDDIVTSGAPFPSFRCYAGEQVVWGRSLAQMLGIREPAATPDVPYPSAWIIPQWRTDEILHARLVRLGGRVELSTELIAFEQNSDEVTATLVRDGIREHVRTGYLVGTDGGRSFVRKELGVGFEGATFETERTVIGDVRVDGRLDHEHCHILTKAGNTSSSDRFSLWGLPGTEYFQLVVNMSADEVPGLTLEAMQDMLEERSGRVDIRLPDLMWISLYRINVRMADRFRVGRVFLAGDAAHVHSSASGPLAWEDRSTPSSVRAGDRAPDAPCHDAASVPTRLFDLFRGPHFTLLAFGADAAAVVAEINSQYHRFVRAYQVARPDVAADGVSFADSDGLIHRSFDIDPPYENPSLVLVRPDGYIGLATCGGGAVERLKSYLDMVTPA